jgi:RHS repeat-associated protein
LNGRLVSTVDSGGVRQDFAYDTFGRFFQAIDRKGPSTVIYRPGTAEKLLVETPDRMWTEFHYDAAARIDWTKRYLVKSSTQPVAGNPTGSDGLYTRFAYNLRGQQVKIWGDLPTPVQNIYFEASDGSMSYELIGQLKEQITYNGGSGWNAAAWPTITVTGNSTTFAYYRENGLVQTETRHKAENSETYSTSYTYNKRGRLATRLDARDITASYAYKAGSGQLQDVTYSPSVATHAIHYTYDRLGAIETVTDAAGVRTFHYRSADHQLDYADLPQATYGPNCRLTMTYDAANRHNGEQFSTPTLSGTLARTYSFSPESGWLTQISTPVFPFTYAYKPNSRLVASISVAPALSVTSEYLPDMDRLLSITTHAWGADYARYYYQYDDQDRLQTAQRSAKMFQEFGTLTETFGYDNRDELTSATTTATPVTTAVSLGDRALAFNYNNAGDRFYADAGGQRTTYTPNSLGQYDSRANPASVALSGLVSAGATVSLRNISYGAPSAAQMTPLNDASYFSGRVPYSGIPSFFTAEATTSYQGQVQDTEQKTILAAAAAETLAYDQAGNLLSDSLWDYRYDGENRLIQVETHSGLIWTIPRIRLVFTYDFLGRRVQKDTYIDDNPSSTFFIPRLSDSRCFVYEGWTLLVELKKAGLGAPVPSTYYAWGLDFSGTVGGSAGVGGLLGIVTWDSAGRKSIYQAINDGLGNVTGLIRPPLPAPPPLSWVPPALVAEYEYSPFGELIRASGPMAAANPIRFSSKYFDYETGLANFGFRFYRASLGRFINRDPKGEQGWQNLLADIRTGGAPSWGYIGTIVESIHERRYGGRDSSLAHSTEASGGYKNSTLTSAPLMERKGATSSVGSPGATEAAATATESVLFTSAQHPYRFLSNNPYGGVDPFGLWEWSESWLNPGNWFGTGSAWGNFWGASGASSGTVFDEVRELGGWIRGNLPGFIGGPLGGGLDSFAGLGNTLLGTATAEPWQIGFGLQQTSQGILEILGLKEALTEPWVNHVPGVGREDLTGGRLPLSLAKRLLLVEANDVPDNAYMNGMHAWHAGTTAELASDLGPIGAIFVWLGGLYHETPLDWASFKQEQQHQGTVNHFLDSATDILANTYGATLGLLLPNVYAAKFGALSGNYIPGPGEPDRAFGGKGDYNGNPFAAWGEYP